MPRKARPGARSSFWSGRRRREAPSAEDADRLLAELLKRQAAQPGGRRGGEPHRPQAPRPLPAGARPEGSGWPRLRAPPGAGRAPRPPRRGARRLAPAPQGLPHPRPPLPHAGRRDRPDRPPRPRSSPSSRSSSGRAFADGAEAVTPAGRRRIARAASLWLAGHPAAAGLDLRFDVVICVPRRLPRHLLRCVRRRRCGVIYAPALEPESRKPNPCPSKSPSRWTTSRGSPSAAIRPSP